MARLTTSRTYENGKTPLEENFDSTIESIETFFNITKIDSGNIANGGIDAGAKLADNSVSSENLAANSVATINLIDNSVAAANLDSSVAGDGIILNGVNKIAAVPDNVTVQINANNQLQVKAASLTNAKLAAQVPVLSASSGAFQTSSTSWIDATNLSGTIVTTGRPVLITLIGDASDSTSYIKAASAAATLVLNEWGHLAIQRNSGSTLFGISAVGSRASSAVASAAFFSPSSFFYIDSVAAGTHVYQIKAAVTESNVTLGLQNCKLFLMEL